LNNFLFYLAEFFSRPPGFYLLLASMAVCSVFAVYGFVGVTTYYLSVMAIVLTGVVLVQNYRDTAAMQAKLDEIVVALKQARNEVVGLEHAAPEKIKEAVAKIEREANGEVNSIAK